MTEIESKYKLSSWDLFKKIISLSAAITGTISVNYPQYLMPGVYYINSYVFMDLFFARRNMVVHHLLVLLFFAATMTYDFPEDYKYYFMRQVVRAEYSTIFYSGGPILLHYLSSHPTTRVMRWIPTVKTLCNVGFAVTFFKVRIYDFAGNVIFLETVYSLDNYPSIIAFFHLIVTTWAFYALNLYWFHLILTKMVPSEENITIIRAVVRI